MAYRLLKLAEGSFDVLLNGVIIAGLVRTDVRHHVRWTAELLLDLPAAERPSPFVEPEHEFATLEEACAWLKIGESSS